MSDLSRLRVIAHASLNVSSLPTVSWETVAASRPVRIVPANVESHCTFKFEIICSRRALAKFSGRLLECLGSFCIDDGLVSEA